MALGRGVARGREARLRNITAGQSTDRWSGISPQLFDPFLSPDLDSIPTIWRNILSGHALALSISVQTRVGRREHGAGVPLIIGERLHSAMSRDGRVAT